MDYSGIAFLKNFLASNQKQPAWGGAPGQEVPPDVLEKMNKPGTPPPPGFFDDLRRKFDQPGVKQAASFDMVPDIDDPSVDRWMRENRTGTNRYMEAYPTWKDFQEKSPGIIKQNRKRLSI